MQDSPPHEHVALWPPATDAAAVVERALAAGASRVVVAPVIARAVVEALRARQASRERPAQNVAVASVVAYPLGLSKPTVKAIEATSLAKDGVDVIEVTPNPAHVIAGDWDALRAELLEIVRGARAARPSVRVEVSVDLAWPGLDVASVPALAATVLRGACDGTILLARANEPALDRLATLQGARVRRHR